MVEVICEKTGLKFEAATRRTKNHPKIMSILSDASREEWYGSAMEVLKAGRSSGFTTIEQYVDRLNDARDQHLGRGKYDYRAYRDAYLPQIEAALKAYMDTYDEAIVPFRELYSYLSKNIVSPIIKTSDASSEMQMRLKNEVVEAAMKPLKDAKAAREKEAKRQLLASFKDREVVKECSYVAIRSDAPYAGDYQFFSEEKRVLRCVHSWYAKADDDMDQFEDAVVCKFAVPTAEEMQSAEYKQSEKWLQDTLKEQEKEHKRDAEREARRTAELNAIRAEGREPDLFEQIFAGSDFTD